MARQVKIEILGDARGLRRAFSEADRASTGFAKGIAKAGVFAATGLAGLIAGVGVAAGKSIQAAQESNKVGKQTEAVLKSTGGAAKVSAKQISDLATTISNKTGIDDEAVQSSENMLLTFCLEESAEALTRDRGWVQHADLAAGDEILAYDPVTNEALWEPITSMHRFQVNGELIRWRSQQIDVATTPQHRWWATGRTATHGVSTMLPYGFKTTQEISGHQYKVMIGGGTPAGFAIEATISDDIVELLGWVMTEGWYVKPQTPNHVSVGFCQSETANPEKVGRIRQMVVRLRAAGHRIGETSSIARYNGSTMLEWHFSGALSRLVHSLLPGKKLTPELFSLLTAKQAGLLLDVLIAGDGHVDANGYRSFIQKDHGQLDMVAMLCAMLGIRTTIGKRPDLLILTTTNHAWGHQLNAVSERYAGVVWCPHLRTGIFLARNNGRTFWTGNTNIRNAAGKNNDIFTQATKITQDMSVALGQDGTKSAVMLGKALQDPVKGVTALRKVGVAFTADQQKQIKTLVDSGHTMEAQKLILRELGVEFGGSAAAAATPLDRLKVIVGNVSEAVGNLLLPMVNRAADWLGSRLPAAVDLLKTGLHALGEAFQGEGVTSDGFVGVMERIGVAARATRLGLLAMAAAFQGEGVTSTGFIGTMERIGVTARPIFEDLRKIIVVGLVPAFRQLGTEGVGGLQSNLALLLSPLALVRAAIGFAADHAKGLRQVLVILLPTLGGIRVALFGLTVVQKGVTVATTAWAAVTKVATVTAEVFRVVTGGVAQTLVGTRIQLIAMAVAQKVAAAAAKVWAATQWLVNAALTANPIGIVVVAIAALVAGIVLAYRNSETFRNIVQGAFKAIRGAVGTAVNFIIGLFRAWFNTTSAVVLGILHMFGKLPGPMGAPFRAAERAVQSAKKTVNDQLDKIQNRVNKLTGKNIPVTASLKLNFSPSYTAKDWTADRLRAGRMAGGGMLRGPGTGTSDSIPLWGSAGEFMVNARSTSKWLPVLKFINADRKAAGGPVGPVGQIGGQTGAVNKIEARGTGVRLHAALAKFIAKFGGGDIKAFLRMADALPYVWGGVGPGGYDCSGLTGEVLNRMQHRPSYHRRFTTASNFPALGFKPGPGGVYQIGVDAGRGHMVGRYAGLPFEAESTRTGIKVGGVATSVFSMPRVYHMAKGGLVGGLADWLGRQRGISVGGDPARLRVERYDRGGMLPPGMSLAYNGTGRGEPVGIDYDKLGRAVAKALREMPPTVAVTDIHAGLLNQKRRTGGVALGLS
jgi:hypothetical protein